MLAVINAQSSFKNKYSDAGALAMAIEQQKRMIRELPHYVEALGLEADGPEA